MKTLKDAIEEAKKVNEVDTFQKIDKGSLILVEGKKFKTVRLQFQNQKYHLLLVEM